MLLFLSLVVATWPYLRDLRDLKSGCRLAKWGILIQVAHVAYQDLAGVNPRSEWKSLVTQRAFVMLIHV